MRLIDVDEFKKFISELPNGENGYSQVYDKSSILDFIDDQPTAYDVDKVEERLKSELSLADKEKERCIKENPLQFDEAKGYARGIEAAMEIAKYGGID